MAEIEINVSEDLHAELRKMIYLTVQESLKDTIKKEAQFANRDYLSKQEAADYLSISLGTLNKYLAEGLESTKIGGRIFIAKADIKKFLDQYK